MPDIADAPWSRREIIGLLAAQIGLGLRVSLRNPVAAVFTVALPLVLFLAFAGLAVSGDDPDRATTFLADFTPALVTFSVITACFLNTGIGTVLAREQGTLKRIRATPLPGGIWLTGQSAASIVMALASAALLFTIGAVAFGVPLHAAHLPGTVVALLGGSASLCALGLASTRLMPTATAAPAVANAVCLPPLMLSGIFFPLDGVPPWLQGLAEALPAKPLTDLVSAATDPSATWSWVDAGVVAGWGLAGAVATLATFRWLPAAQWPARRSISRATP